MSTHTKGPWGYDTCPDANGFETIRQADRTSHGNTDSQPIATVFRLDDAAFIVRACNSHEELVKALKLCVEALEFIPCRARNEATEAIRLAEGRD